MWTHVLSWEQAAKRIGRLTVTGSICRHWATHSFMPVLQVPPSSLAGVVRGMRAQALRGSMPKKGGLPVAISYAVTPSDQMSALVSYILPSVMTSGAIQSGVPMKVERLLEEEGR